EGVRGWLLDRQILDSDVFEFIGGFNEGVGTNDSNIATTWYALKGLETLTALDQVDAEAAAEFILNCQAADGSWGLVPGISSGRLYFAGQAIESLAILGDTYITMLNQENPHNIPPPLIDWRWAVVIGIIITAIILGLVALRLD
ncbi:MAG: prenyltransferase/squalene oxidase repeat-containing protein, partial [Candidatus Hodarchaeota archaeon]